MDNQIIYNRLLNLVKLFKNRPYHLAKYLVENDALSQKFISRLSNNKSLDEVKLLPPHFDSISDMNNFFNSVLLDFDPEKVTQEELTLKLNDKLNQLISDELYEDAIRVRDYMISRNIKRIS
jgi:arginine utilization protein RocB